MTQGGKRVAQNPQAVGAGRGEPLDLGPGACWGLLFRRYPGVCWPLGLEVPPECPCTQFSPQVASHFLPRAQPPFQVSFGLEFQAAGRSMGICPSFTQELELVPEGCASGKLFFQGSLRPNPCPAEVGQGQRPGPCSGSLCAVSGRVCLSGGHCLPAGASLCLQRVVLQPQCRDQVQGWPWSPAAPS